MERIKCLVCQYFCSECQRNLSYSEETKSCSVIKKECPHFALIFLKINDGQFKYKITVVCKSCDKAKIYEFKVGKKNPQGGLITDDMFSHNCCETKVDMVVFLSEDYIEENSGNAPGLNINPNFNNNPRHLNNHNINNNSNRNQQSNNSIQAIIDNDTIIDSDDDNNTQINRGNLNLEQMLNSMNIIEFTRKNELIQFMYEKNPKKYKIYTKKDLVLKNVLEDLCSQFPELSYKNKKLFLNGNQIQQEAKLNHLNLNEDSIIIIK